ncbi:alpha-L-rhamnosidase C-terminal domain-containing protein [Hydrogenophaga sp.]|uniref:alpha-L-rhamnosidase-related protein n=1 Tax=Hydrogenophaga sp. TaxID=1904254 RepID=UPI00271F1ED7|nr:alpha-L-rhamnosidase C-terminal domain-containing protein [Hydrogenophaga sp.]MDO8905075.1 alpha-L-rhamnosidase C-terminal domain-containing protein [Hydrogenophaga sp.]
MILKTAIAVALGGLLAASTALGLLLTGPAMAENRIAAPHDSMAQASLGAPLGLSVSLLTHPHDNLIRDALPAFSWQVNDPRRGALQSAYQIRVEAPGKAQPFWDSGKIVSADSVAVRHSGPPLNAGEEWSWRVRTWDDDGQASPWSESQRFRTADEVFTTHQAAPADPANTDFSNRPRPVFQVDHPVQAEHLGEGHWFFDFGQARFGQAVIVWPEAPATTVRMHLGEMRSAQGQLERQPPGTVRYQAHDLVLEPSPTLRQPVLQWQPPPWLKSGFIATPPGTGEVMPFRFVELEAAPAGFRPEYLRRHALALPHDATAAHFRSSSPDLDAVWDLSRHTALATTFLGIYVDGDRERLPYEGDAHIHQLSHYNQDRSYATARHTLEFLLQQPTWPLEWQVHPLLMAWEDLLHTGDTALISVHQERLAASTLTALARSDGLIVNSAERQTAAFRESLGQGRRLHTLVDWPPGERDGHVITPVDAVANAYHHRGLVLMGRIALALGQMEEAEQWQARAEKVRNSFHRVFFDTEMQRYRDGEGVDHHSLHANLFALRFGLVPEAHRSAVLGFVHSRGMAASVYGAQHLLDALYEHGEAQTALDRMRARGPRTWLNMLEQGSTMTLEAWDLSAKSNLDWNHAWGSAPANVIPRRLVGVRPLLPGARHVLVQPQPGDLDWFDARVPTQRGPVDVQWQRRVDGHRLMVQVPANTRAELHLPASTDDTIRTQESTLQEVPDIRVLRRNNSAVVLDLPAGRHEFDVSRRSGD